jgi:hypothetical protein
MTLPKLIPTEGSIGGAAALPADQDVKLFRLPTSQRPPIGWRNGCQSKLRPMIKHIVMWNVRGETNEEKMLAARDLQARFEDLVGRIPGLHHLEIGIDVSKVSYACDVVLDSEFEDEEALAACADEPALVSVP